jgi:hypothetical protein
MLHLESNIASETKAANVAELLATNFIKDSDEYLKTFSKSQPFIINSLNILINDKQKINNLGAPIRLISHDLFENDPDINVNTLKIIKCINKTQKIRSIDNLILR